MVVRVRGGAIQVRAAHPGKLTVRCEQAFLFALSATANVRMSAAAAGASPAAFYRRRRTNPGFAREYRLALAQGYERIEAALLESWTPEAQGDDAWRHNEPPAMPPMTPAQALQLLYLHQKEVRLLAAPPHIRRRRGESNAAWSFRLSAMYEARLERDREAYRVAQAARAAGTWRPGDEPPAPVLLAWEQVTGEQVTGEQVTGEQVTGEQVTGEQVTGWSKADPKKPPHDPGRALFGGWRIGDMKRKIREG